MVPHSRLSVLEKFGSDLEDIDPPEPLRATMRNHCNDLERLALNLQNLGMDDRVIEAEILGLFEEYKNKLKAAIVATRQQDT